MLFFVALKDFFFLLYTIFFPSRRCHCFLLLFIVPSVENSLKHFLLLIKESRLERVDLRFYNYIGVEIKIHIKIAGIKTNLHCTDVTLKRNLVWHNFDSGIRLISSRLCIFEQTKRGSHPTSCHMTPYKLYKILQKS